MVPGWKKKLLTGWGVPSGESDTLPPNQINIFLLVSADPLACDGKQKTHSTLHGTVQGEISLAPKENFVLKIPPPRRYGKGWLGGGGDWNPPTHQDAPHPPPIGFGGSRTTLPPPPENSPVECRPSIHNDPPPPVGSVPLELP